MAALGAGRASLFMANEARSRFPRLCTQSATGYELTIRVHPGPHHIRVRAPTALGGGGSQGCWPTTAFQSLLVASEYCAAVQELLAWAFPSPAWDDYKPMVAQFAAEFITTAAPVPVTAATPPTGAQLDPVLLHCSHSLWSNFTYLYFHGTRDLNLEGLGNETRQAAQWLKRLVGERGWAPDGLVFSAARAWIELTRGRLALVCTSIPGLSTPLADTGGGTPVEVEALHRRTWAGCPVRKVKDTDSNEQPYKAMFPRNITNGTVKDKANRIRSTLSGVEAPRKYELIRCGLPAGFTPTKNCTLGFLVLSDFLNAFEESYAAGWANIVKGSDEEKKTDVESTIKGFHENVYSGDNTTPLLSVHGIHRYAHVLAGCCLGWAAALGQVRGWVNAAAAALPDVAADNAPPQLVLPATLAPELLQAMAAVVQQMPAAPPPPAPQQLQPQEPPPPQPQPQHLRSAPPLPLTVQLPRMASGSSMPLAAATGPPTAGSDSSGAGSSTCRSPFALQQLAPRHHQGEQQQPQAEEQQQWPGRAVLAPETLGVAGGTSTQPPGLTPLSPTADVVGTMGSLSLDPGTFGESTMEALARDLAETAAGMPAAGVAVPAAGGCGPVAPPPAASSAVDRALGALHVASPAGGAPAGAAQLPPAPGQSHAASASSSPPADDIAARVTQALGLLNGAAGLLDPSMQEQLGPLLQGLVGFRAALAHTPQPGGAGAPSTGGQQEGSAAEGGSGGTSPQAAPAAVTLVRGPLGHDKAAASPRLEHGPAASTRSAQPDDPAPGGSSGR
ncbi:hypothetical protein HXX76_008654 [Chlamydomonas incerta]|uniref:Uncharacterized protein n=1 Tax=Chlamydomonas incerta TaxID=51695 RepID=A0A835STH6_CHLIN|nr:hypothetical protein HXX76_008654 [Chlamydomonas incerta]|eukprot:KAG2432924.1 hypothetical protein HXX76_008654 [Chlamydomonas incerta]